MLFDPTEYIWTQVELACSISFESGANSACVSEYYKIDIFWILFSKISAGKQANTCEFSPMTTSISAYVESRPPSLGHGLSECGGRKRERERAVNLSKFDAHLSSFVVMLVSKWTSIVKLFLAQAQQATISSPFAACSKMEAGYGIPMHSVRSIVMPSYQIASFTLCITLPAVFTMLIKRDLFMSQYNHIKSYPHMHCMTLWQTAFLLRSFLRTSRPAMQPWRGTLSKLLGGMHLSVEVYAL